MVVSVGNKKREVKTSEDLIKAMDEEDTSFASGHATEAAELDSMVDTVMEAYIDDGTWYGYNTLTWNLMCHSKNSVFMQLEHMAWNGDVFTIRFVHSKKDMQGKESRKSRHIFANLLIPEICAVLSLG
jgi:hypothetical protein